MVRFTSKIPQARAQAHERASIVVRKTVFDIEAAAKSRAPVDTGNLQNSIAGEMKGPLSGEIRATADYAGSVELGTSKAPAQPYMVPSAEEHRAAFKAAMKQIL